MPRTVLSTLLFLVVAIVLSRDATWQPLVNEASAENVIQAYLGRQEREIICDCASLLLPPTPSWRANSRGLLSLLWY